MVVALDVGWMAFSTAVLLSIVATSVLPFFFCVLLL